MKKLLMLSCIGVFFTFGYLQAQSSSKFTSKNFYGNGINEHLVMAGNGKKITYYYYTSTRSQRIKLIVVSSKEINHGYGTEGTLITKVRFPNDTKVYKLIFTVGQIECVHPNGKKQMFYYYH